VYRPPIGTLELVRLKLTIFPPGDLDDCSRTNESIECKQSTPDQKRNDNNDGERERERETSLWLFLTWFIDQRLVYFVVRVSSIAALLLLPVAHLFCFFCFLFFLVERIDNNSNQLRSDEHLIQNKKERE